MIRKHKISQQERESDECNADKILIERTREQMIDVDESWLPFFEEESKKPYLHELAAKVKEEYAAGTCYPPYEKIFNAFKQTPKDNVKVVILGQDPYHGAGQAQGLSFSVPDNQKIQPSLINIAKELEDEMGHPCIDVMHGDLTEWARQGVFLLNTSLTVRAHEAGSHSKLGWQQFTDAVIAELDASDDPIVFLLWGAHAQSKKELLTNPNHLVLMSPHPSPFSAHKGFFGNGHFKKANEWLVEQGREPIEWKLSSCGA